MSDQPLVRQEHRARFVALSIDSDECWQDPEVPAYAERGGEATPRKLSDKWPYDPAGRDPFAELAERF